MSTKQTTQQTPNKGVKKEGFKKNVVTKQETKQILEIKEKVKEKVVEKKDLTLKEKNNEFQKDFELLLEKYKESQHQTIWRNISFIVTTLHKTRKEGGKFIMLTEEPEIVYVVLIPYPIRHEKLTFNLLKVKLSRKQDRVETIITKVKKWCSDKSFKHTTPQSLFRIILDPTDTRTLI